MSFSSGLKLFLIWTCQFFIASGQLSDGSPLSSYYAPSLFTPFFVNAGQAKNNALAWFKEPLYGVTYVPFRKSTNCSKVSEREIVEDLRNISRLAHYIYVPEMYCNFGPLIARTVSTLGNRLILGLSLKTKPEFERQFKELKLVFQSKVLH